MGDEVYATIIGNVVIRNNIAPIAQYIQLGWILTSSIKSKPENTYQNFTIQAKNVKKELNYQLQENKSFICSKVHKKKNRNVKKYIIKP